MYSTCSSTCAASPRPVSSSFKLSIPQADNEIDSRSLFQHDGVDTTSGDESFYAAEDGGYDSDEESLVSFNGFFGGVADFDSEGSEEFEECDVIFESQTEEWEGQDPLEGEYGNLSSNDLVPEPSGNIDAEPIIGFPPHICNCACCPSRTEGFIPTSRLINDEYLSPGNNNQPIPPLVLTPSKKNAGNPPNLGTSLALRNLGSNNWEEPQHQRTFTLPPIRSLDIWYDRLPDSPSPNAPALPIPPCLTSPQFSPTPPSTAPNQREVIVRDTAGHLVRLTSSINIIPDCSKDLIRYSLSLTRAVQTDHPSSSRETDSGLLGLEFPGRLEVRDPPS